MTKKCTPDVVVMVPLPNKKVNCVLSDCICSYFHLITMLTLHDSTRLHGQLNVCRYMVELTTVLTFKEEKCDKRATIWIETSRGRIQNSFSNLFLRLFSPLFSKMQKSK